MTRTSALLVSFLLSACSADLGGSDVSGGGGDSPDLDEDTDRVPVRQASPEECNHFDDDLDGLVDDGCPCEEGATQWCWPGAAGQQQVGACAPGLQVCDVSQVEFPEWGPCQGAVLPARDACDDGLDQDCDGADRSCAAPDGDDDEPGPVGDPEDPAQQADDDPEDPAADQEPADDPADDPGNAQDVDDCEPAPEQCGNGVDEDCDGADEECQVVEVDLFIIGDCVTATCPPQAPFPIGCDVFFTPGDDRGCVASRPDESTVYFQAGDQCDEGLVWGTLLCYAAPGDPLDEDNCPINKPVPIYADDRDGCPDVH